MTIKLRYDMKVYENSWQHQLASGCQQKVFKDKFAPLEQKQKVLFRTTIGKKHRSVEEENNSIFYS